MACRASRRSEDLAAHSGLHKQTALAPLVRRCKKLRLPSIIAKKSGGTRLIQRPTYPLRSVQRWILRNILDQLAHDTEFIGFERGSKLRLHAIEHGGAPAVPTIEIKTSSIDINRASDAGVSKRRISFVGRIDSRAHCARAEVPYPRARRLRLANCVSVPLWPVTPHLFSGSSHKLRSARRAAEVSPRERTATAVNDNARTRNVVRPRFDAPSRSASSHRASSTAWASEIRR